MFVFKFIVPEEDNKQFIRFKVPTFAVVTFTLLVEISIDTLPEAWAANTFSVITFV
jgi:hypothetical protein